MRRNTRYKVSKRELSVGMGRDDTVPTDLLDELRADGMLESVNVRQRRYGKVLVVTLRRRNGLLPLDLLCQFAARLRTETGSVAVYDPWTRGGQPVNVPLALDLIGETIRHAGKLCTSRW